LGLGYVGCVTAACLAHLGHRVIGVDRDEFKVQSVETARAPFYEPGLEELIRQGRERRLLSATTSLEDALAEADIALICVGTPSQKNGGLSLEQLTRVCGEIAPRLPTRSRRLIVAVRSTVFPGTCEEVVFPALGGSGRAVVVSNPEFLREGTAVRDFMEPSLVVVGGEDAEAVRAVADLYAPLAAEPCLVSLPTAEMIKYACNTFHALKIGFANEIGVLCSQLGVSGGEVMDTLCRDTRLNISRAYLKPGFAFGGSCLPKDLRALVHRAIRLDLKLPLLESVLPSNDRHLQRGMQAVLDLPGEHIGVFGLSFKENTDDLRESPAVALLEYLSGKGRNVRVFDPHIRLEDIYGSNQRFLMTTIPHIGKLMEPDLQALLSWCHHLVLTQYPDAASDAAIRASGVPVLDLAGARAAPALAEEVLGKV